MTPRIYVASEVKHASLWLSARADGYPIISTWIDEAGPGETPSLAALWERIVPEVLSADAFVIFRDGFDEILKGAYVELGIALAAGLPIYAVGFDDAHAPSFMQHPQIRKTYQSIAAALDAAMHDGPAGQRTPDPATKRALVQMVRRRVDDAASIVCLPKVRMLELLSLIPIRERHPWNEVPEFTRAGNCECPQCCRTYDLHPQHEYVDEYGMRLPLYLHKLCDGTYVKL
jgi:nucleoside 2-deoxyribosyltransferase